MRYRAAGICGWVLKCGTIKNWEGHPRAAMSMVLTGTRSKERTTAHLSQAEGGSCRERERGGEREREREREKETETERQLVVIFIL